MCKLCDLAEKNNKEYKEKFKEVDQWVDALAEKYLRLIPVLRDFKLHTGDEADELLLKCFKLGVVAGAEQANTQIYDLYLSRRKTDLDERISKRQMEMFDA